jgi:hypothetical protein
MTMISLEKEIELCVENCHTYDELYCDGLRSGFIAGVNSKYMEVEKIKSKIEVLEKILDISKKHKQDDATKYFVLMELSHLRKSLNNLDNE